MITLEFYCHLSRLHETLVLVCKKKMIINRKPLPMSHIGGINYNHQNELIDNAKF